MSAMLLAITLICSLCIFGWASGLMGHHDKSKAVRQNPGELVLLQTDWSASYALYHQPHAIWLSEDGFVGANRKKLNETLSHATQKRQNPELVIYGIPLRDLGQSSDGGFKTYEDYLKDNELNAGIIRDFVQKTGLTPRVYLEPDALSLALQYRVDNSNNEESSTIYRQRITVFPKLIRLYQDAGALVYLEAAHSDWFDYSEQQVDSIAAVLNQAGIQYADGLASNISNRQTLNSGERNEVHYLSRLLPRLENKALDIVVDTSRNGGPTFARQYWLASNGALVDNEVPGGRLVGEWKKDSDGQVRIFPFFGKPKTLSQLLQKEKYQFNLKKSVLIAPKWLDPVGDVQLGLAPGDKPPLQAAQLVHRLRHIKPPDDCDGALNCQPGQSKHAMIEETRKRQPAQSLQIPTNTWV